MKFFDELSNYKNLNSWTRSC